MTTSKITAPFELNGKLTKISAKKKKIQYIKLKTEGGKYWIKVPKQLREKIASLPRGCQLEVSGTSKQDQKKGRTKYKAETVIVVPQDPPATTVVTKTVSLLPVFDRQTKSKAKVLICQKSNCWKKGGKQVHAELESVFSNCGLTDAIPIKKTGCLNQCKKAPTLVMLPDKARYSKVKPKQITRLVDKHLIAE